jgi:hypothetical protein
MTEKRNKLRGLMQVQGLWNRQKAADSEAPAKFLPQSQSEWPA